jgi:hypothetical protein
MDPRRAGAPSRNKRKLMRAKHFGKIVLMM